MNLQSICSKLNQYLVESEDLYWQNWVGLKEEIDIAALTEKTGALFSLDSINLIREHLHKADSPDEVHRLRSILGQLTLSFMENAGASIQEQVLKEEATTTVEWKGKTIALRSMNVMIMNEQDPSERRELIDLRNKTLDKVINPLKKQLVETMFQSVKDMGFANYIDLCQETQDRDFRAFAEQMERFLEDTEDIYRKYLDYYLQKLTGQSLTDATHSADLSAVMRCNLFDDFFPHDNLLPTLKKTIAGMGFSLDKIHLDLEDRPGKKPRPCVSAVNPPEDVRLTIYPVGGFEDYSGLLHESGHALHFVHETPDLDFIFKFWGDRGFTEGIAYLFQNITMNPAWLKNMMGIENIDPLIRYTAFMGILRFRRLIGQFLYLMEMFETENPDSNRYIYHYSRAHQVQFDAGNYLNFDMEFYAAGYLRARMFELQIREYLVRTFGKEWWNTENCGEYLKTLFVNGRKNRADYVVDDLGFESLNPDYYRKRYCEMLI